MFTEIEAIYDRDILSNPEDDASLRIEPLNVEPDGGNQFVLTTEHPPATDAHVPLPESLENYLFW